MKKDVINRIEENLRKKDSYLDLDSCGIIGNEPELEMLSECKQLEELSLNGNQIQNLSFLKWIINLDELVELSLNNNQIINIDGIQVLKHLKYFDKLDLSDNQIQDISLISELKHLYSWTLYLENNQIQDISVLGEFRYIETLLLKGNPIQYINRTCLPEIEPYIFSLSFSYFVQPPPIWLINFYKNKDYSLSYNQLPFLEKIWQLIQSKDAKNRALAHQLALGQGWTEEEFEMYKSLTENKYL